MERVPGMKITRVLILLLALAGTTASQQKICKKHPDWTAEECAKVASKKLFVGMTWEMINAEKPHSCVRNRHPANPQGPDAVSFICYAQWDHSEQDRIVPFMLHFKLAGGRVTEFFYN